MRQFVKNALANLEGIEAEMSEDQDWFKRLRRDEKQTYRKIMKHYSSIVRSKNFFEDIEGGLKDLRNRFARWLELEEKDLQMIQRLKKKLDDLVKQEIVPLENMQNMLVIADAADGKIGDVLERLKQCTEFIEDLISRYESGTIRENLHEKTKKAEYRYVVSTLGRVVEIVRRTFKDEKRLFRGMIKGLKAEKKELKPFLEAAKEGNPGMKRNV